jgi:hypothetical protein
MEVGFICALVATLLAIKSSERPKWEWISTIRLEMITPIDACPV